MTPSRGRIRSPSRRREGITLVEACALTCVGGIVLAVAVPTFSRHLRISKTAEAAEQLAALHRGTAAYYARGHADSDGHTHIRCLPEAAGPTPAEPSRWPQRIDFAAPNTPGAGTWRAIGFAPEEPTRYRYSVLPEEPGCGLDAAGHAHRVTFAAEGDLDGDRVLSRFERRATAKDGELVPAGVLIAAERME